MLIMPTGSFLAKNLTMAGMISDTPVQGATGSKKCDIEYGTRNNRNKINYTEQQDEVKELKTLPA